LKLSNPGGGGPRQDGKNNKPTKPDKRPDSPKKFGNGSGVGNGVGNRQDD
jgi:hypothetical protein